MGGLTKENFQVDVDIIHIDWSTFYADFCKNKISIAIYDDPISYFAWLQ